MIQNNSLSLDFQSRFITDFNFGHYEHTTFYTLVDLYPYDTTITSRLFWGTVYRKLGNKSGRKAYRTPHLKNTLENVHLEVRGHILQTLHQTALLLKRTGWEKIHAEVGIDDIW